MQESMFTPGQAQRLKNFFHAQLRLKFILLIDVDLSTGYEPPHGKTNNLHRRKQRRRSASQ